MNKPKRPNISDLRAHLPVRGAKCKTCQFPERRWLEDAREKGFTSAAIIRYLLNDCGFETYQIDYPSVAKHFREKHHCAKTGHH